MNNERKSPPHERLTLRVGVTGHRPEGLESTDDRALKSGLDRVLKELKRIVGEIKIISDNLYTPEEPLLRIISPLAAGADMLAAEAALENAFELQCAIPFERSEYEKDFRTENSIARYRDMLENATEVLELEGSRRSKALENESYQAVGRMVLDQSDVIIAVWDGKEARGKGGTGQIVKEALGLEIPVIWIDSAPEHELRVLTGKEKAHEEDALSGLDKRLKQLFIPSSVGDSGIRNAYFSETRPQRTPGFIFEVFCDFFAGEKIDISGVYVKDFERQTREEWRHSSSPEDESPQPAEYLQDIGEQVDEKLLLHYSWADNLAKYYSNVYRSSFVTNYLLAGLAVFFALLSITSPSLEKLWIFTELLIIGAILIITWVGNRNRWHERWIDYRLLSEQIRQLRFLAPLGLTTPSFRVPAHDTHGDPRNTWVNWHFRAIVRHLGIVSARIDKDYLESYRSLLSEHEIKGQIDYHDRNSPRFHKIHRNLHKLGSGLFFLTLIAVLLHFPFSYDWLTLCAAVFPALGAAFYGIRTQGEFEQIAKRSQAMSAKLRDIKGELDSPGFNMTYRDLAIIAENTAEIILSETLDWRIVFQSKRLVLPV